MEDVTDLVFRRLLWRWSARWAGTGPAVLFTEFVRVDAPQRALDLAAKQRPIPPRLEREAAEAPLVCQLWGTRPQEFERAAQVVAQLGFDAIDLNMGCPAAKIRKKGACSQLIAQPQTAAEIIAACRAGCDLPLSVKTRVGLDRVITEQWCGFLLEQQLDAVILHGRTADQMSEGHADWTQVACAVRLRDAIAPQTIVVGNGDVTGPADARERIVASGADGAMVGRGVFGDPLLFARWSNPEVPRFSDLSPTLRLRYLAEHIGEYDRTWGTRRSYEVLKKFFKNYVYGAPESQALLDRLYATHEATAALQLIEQVATAA